MKTDARTSIALVLLAIGTTAVAQTSQAQDAQPQQPIAPPQPGQPQAPQPSVPAQGVPLQQAPQVAPQPVVPPGPPASPPPPQYGTAPTVVPQSPPPATYPTSPQYQYPPATPQQQPPPPAQYAKPQWVHSESGYPDSDNSNGFHYHPFRFHIDGGGTLTQKSNSEDFADGWNAGFGFTWYPTSHLPLGLRVDGTYNQFSARTPLLAQVAAANGPGVYHGFQRMYGGDTDLELDLPFSPYFHGYLLAGGGWYKQQTIFREGFGCGGWDCGNFGYTVGRYDSDWHFARNAGAGIEFAMGSGASFFIEGRYMRLDPNDAKSDFIPIRAGLRF